ncbi:glutaredoxin family protein [Pseudoteredinibacter isoporae]|uniref:glutaredoxin family protein n=1 Tax=Pseudoteredinibacter isoporae TaxID=570281 RepID=UPI00310467D8
MMKLTYSLVLILLSFSAYSQIYKWVDDDGKVHYSDSKNRPVGQNAEKLTLKVNTYTNISYQVEKKRVEKVVMYSASWCGYCKKARKYFASNSIPFVEYDIETNKRAKREHEKMGATGVPVILYGNKRMNGFSVEGFKRIYTPG